LAIVDLDKGTSRQPRGSDRALIVGLGAAIFVFATAIWLSAPHPAATATAVVPSSAAIAGGAISRTGSVPLPAAPPSAVRGVDPSARPLVLPANLDNVDLFLVPERITNENLIWTLRSIVRIRGGVGLASIEGPSIVTWTEKGFQYWMISSTRTTDDLIKIADDLP
jgi:hypothetical protein